ncbi:MAG: hypothetical protein NTW86_18340 [Candidatus Sumerlaeota bacterium]|nr:hypothetical protein [Candidatus Sumerlaeota bacterium]
MKQSLFVWFAILFSNLLSDPSYAQEAIRLTSKEDLKKNFNVIALVEDPITHMACFSGEFSGSKTLMWKMDPDKLTVEPLLAPNQTFPDRGEFEQWMELQASPMGGNAALTRTAMVKGGEIGDIYLVDIASGRAEELLVDGQQNYGLGFSPDGRFLAYYSSGIENKYGHGQPVSHSAARLINVDTKQVSEIRAAFVDTAQHGGWTFPPPQWLDGEKVLFCTLSSNKEEIAAHAKEFQESLPGKNCPVATLFDVATSQTKSIFVPDGTPKSVLAPTAFVDAKRKVIYLFSNQYLVLKTDFEFSTPAVVVKSEKPMGVHVRGIKEDGELDYEVWETKETKPEDYPAILFGPAGAGKPTPKQ